jgi:hypothetical protein
METTQTACWRLHDPRYEQHSLHGWRSWIKTVACNNFYYWYVYCVAGETAYFLNLRNLLTAFDTESQAANNLAIIYNRVETKINHWNGNIYHY